jgi:1-acyl-sn-glycerol-3-phosphate acyltransferase
MKQAYLLLRCGLLWIVSLFHFAVFALFLLLLAIFVDPRKTDFLQRLFARNVVRLAGARLRVQHAPGFDPTRTSIIISNHVNLFDPFVLYSAVPQFIRGWELESHFKIPVYGWMMKRFGNVPVPGQKSPGGIRRLFQQTEKALAGGVSLVVFPEGGRTLDGLVKPFQKGIFRLAPELKVPIVPVSIVGSFEFNRKGSHLLLPSTIVVHVHDTIYTDHLTPQEANELCDRVYRIISAPVDAARRASAPHPHSDSANVAALT